MAKRRFPVTDSVKKQVLARQRGCCAMCGEDLPQDTDEYNFHHVIPDQAGDPSDPRDAFLGTAGNIVAICSRESRTGLSCHDVAHAGNSQQGAVPPFDYFEYASPNARVLASFVEEGMRHWERVFDRLAARFKKAKEEFERAQEAARQLAEHQQREGEHLMSVIEDIKAGRATESDLANLLRRYNSAQSAYQWKYDKRFVREYQQGDYLVTEYEITLKCQGPRAA
jgi:hypothetical protein